MIVQLSFMNRNLCTFVIRWKDVGWELSQANEAKQRKGAGFSFFLARCPMSHAFFLAAWLRDA
jgi:hypothetical protein